MEATIGIFPSQFFCKKCQQYVYEQDVRSEFFLEEPPGPYLYITYHVAGFGLQAVICQPVMHMPTHRQIFYTLN